MKEQAFKDLILDYILDKLEESEIHEFELFLSEHPVYQKEIDQLRSIYQVDQENNIPETSLKMDDNFHAFLSEEVNAHKKNQEIPRRFGQLFNFNHILGKMVYAAFILIMGVFIGFKLIPDTKVKQLVDINDSQEIEKVRSQLVMALIDQPSANKRLQGINEVAKLDQVTEVVTAALFKTLNNDPNTNVRLAAIGSLSNYTQNPQVREELIKSISQQEAPMVQIALAELMVIIQEKSAVEQMQKMLKKPNLNRSAKQKLQESINTLI